MISDEQQEAAFAAFMDAMHHDLPLSKCLEAALEAAEKAAWQPMSTFGKAITPDMPPVLFHPDTGIGATHWRYRPEAPDE